MLVTVVVSALEPFLQVISLKSVAKRFAITEIVVGLPRWTLRTRTGFSKLDLSKPRTHKHFICGLIFV